MFFIFIPKQFTSAAKIIETAIICVIVFTSISRIRRAPIIKPIIKLKNIGKNL